MAAWVATEENAIRDAKELVQTFLALELTEQEQTEVLAACLLYVSGNLSLAVLEHRMGTAYTAATARAKERDVDA